MSGLSLVAELEGLVEACAARLDRALALEELEAARVEYLGRKGLLAAVMAQLPGLFYTNVTIPLCTSKSRLIFIDQIAASGLPCNMIVTINHHLLLLTNFNDGITGQITAGGL